MTIPMSIMLRDAEMKMQSFQGMSHEYAASGHAWLAVHAQVASDLSAADLAAMETTDSSWSREEAAQRILNVADTGVSAFDYSQAVREQIASTLDAITFSVWREIISSLSHLEPLIDVSPTALQAGHAERFGDVPVEEYIWERLTTAEQNTEKAQNLTANAGSTSAAIMAQYEADVAAFEAWLLQRSLSIGDSTLTQYELMWSLGMASVAALPPLPAGPEEARHVVLSRFVWAVGPAESEEFITYVLHPESLEL